MLSSTHSSLQNYQLGPQIGRGQFGKVYQARTLTTGEPVAIKAIPLSRVSQNPQLKKLISNQIKVLHSLKHPNVIKFHNLFCDESLVFMVYQLCETDTLQDLIPLPCRSIVRIFRQIIDACAFAEQNCILHRDLKPANILFKGDEVKVADWGFSRPLKLHEQTQSYLGSPAYMAPEVLNGQKYSSKADVWSLGVMLYECIHGRLPWAASNVTDLQSRQKKEQVFMEEGVPMLLQKIVKKCLAFNPNKRATFAQLKALISRRHQENPEAEEESTQSILSKDDIRKCSFYLEFTKSIPSQACNPTNCLCLKIMAQSLRELREQKFTNKSIESEDFTLKLLNKEIDLIDKVLDSNTARSLPSEKSSNLSKAKQKLKLLSLLRGELGNLKKSSVRASDRKAKLIWVTNVLNVLEFDSLPDKIKSLRLEDSQKELYGVSSRSLLDRIEKRIGSISMS